MRILGRKTRSAGSALTPTSQYGRRPSWLVDGLSVTAYEGAGNLEVVGESHRQPALWAIAAQLEDVRPGEDVRCPIHAVLVAEEGNPYDRNAVAVWVAGELVGYLSRDDAEVFRSALIRLQQQSGKAVAMPGVIVGGGPDRPSLGVFLNFDPAPFGLSPRAYQSWGDLRTGFSRAAQQHPDGPWVLLDGTDASPERVRQLRRLLDHEVGPVVRHYTYAALEATLYHARTTSETALPEYDEVCMAHQQEMPAIRAALLGEFDDELPEVDLFRQASIRCSKAHRYDWAKWWAERGLDYYADDQGHDEQIHDLRQRVERAERQLGLRAEPEPEQQVESLVCRVCGREFQRVVQRGRKPHSCPECRAAEAG